MCGKCRYRYTVTRKSGSADEATKKQALTLYLEGLGFRSIGRILKVSHVAVYKWMKAFGSTVQHIREQEAAEIVEIDEMHSYIARKKTTAGFGLLLIDLEKRSSILCLAAEELKQA